MVPSEQLVKFLKRELGDVTDDGPILRVELFHAIEGEGPERLAKVTIEEEGTDAEELAIDLTSIAEHDATTRMSGTPERYVVATFRKLPEPEAQHAFIVRASRQSVTGSSTETASEKGLLAQFMRHLEAKDRVLMQMYETTTGALVKDLDQERNLRLGLERARMEVLETQQNLLDRKSERDVSQAVALQRAKRMDELAGMFMASLPAISARLFGSALGAEFAGVARDQAIGKFLKNLSFEEVSGVLGSLKPTNQRALIEVYQSYKETFEKEQSNLPEVLRDGSQEALQTGQESSAGSVRESGPSSAGTSS